jgi:hypothetical protein
MEFKIFVFRKQSDITKRKSRFLLFYCSGTSAFLLKLSEFFVFQLSPKYDVFIKTFNFVFGKHTVWQHILIQILNPRNLEPGHDFRLKKEVFISLLHPTTYWSLRSYDRASWQIPCEWNQQTHWKPILLVLWLYMFRVAFLPIITSS